MVSDDFMSDLINIGNDNNANIENKVDTDKIIDVISTKITNQLSSKIDEITKKVDEMQKNISNEKEINENDSSIESEQGINKD